MNVSTQTKSASAYSDSKQHYLILDALRGIAAIFVLQFHILEAIPGYDRNYFFHHSYLAVDFFFMLSGFVIAYSYDDRWSKLSFGNFMKRRVIRLHPMIIIGMVIGALTFYLSDCDLFEKVSSTSVLSIIGVMLLGFFLIPLPARFDIRGWGDMFPLNGASWSLFFEYIAYILYALFLRKLKTKTLTVITGVFAVFLVYMAIHNGTLEKGFSLSDTGFVTGLARVLFPFSLGALMSRVVKPRKIKGSFIICFVLLVASIFIPRLEINDNLLPNAIYDSLCIMLIFPIIIYFGACAKPETTITKKLAVFLGDISYPLYMIHQPLVFIFLAWVSNNGLLFHNVIPQMIFTMICIIGLAYTLLKVYDIPVRKFLANKFIKRK